MSTTKEYDPKDVKISLIGVPLNAGIADGTFVKVTRNAVAATMTVGAGGDVVITRSHDHTGKAEVTVQRASQVNALLSAMAAAWEAGTGGRGAFFVRDLNGASLCVAPNAVIEKPADFERGKEHGNITWSILLDDVEIIEAGFEA